MSAGQRHTMSPAAETLRALREPPMLVMSIGDMEFPTDPEVLNAMTERINGPPFQYQSPEVTSLAVGRICSYYSEFHDLGVRPEEVWLAPASLAQSHLILDALIAQDDEVLIVAPHFKYLVKGIRVAGGQVVAVPHMPADVVGAFATAVSDRARGIYLVHPHNPTGYSYSPAELLGIAELAERHDLWILSNELHSRLTFRGTHTPMASVSDHARDRTITLSGATKSHNLAGVGGSFALIPDGPCYDRLRTAVGDRLSPASALQRAALAAAYIGDSPWLIATRDRILHASQRIVARLRSAGAQVTEPDATFFVWADFHEVFADTQSPAADQLREMFHIEAAAGADFGSSATFARFTVAIASLNDFETKLAGLGNPCHRVSRSPIPSATC